MHDLRLTRRGALRCLSLTLAALPQMATAQPERPPGGGYLEEQGDLQALVATFKETLPSQDSFAYRVPHPDETGEMVGAVSAVLLGNLDEAAWRLEPLGYELVRFHDAPRAGDHLILRERLPYARCWGLYLINLSEREHPVSIEVPHPIWDVYTPELGIEAYLRLAARHLLIAGAHRFANGKSSRSISDVARTPGSVFQALHGLLTDPTTEVLQLHGFRRDNHPGYPNVVLSNGSAQPHPELLALANAIEQRGETVGVFDGERWADLGATGNVQGEHTRSIGGRFYHLESRFGIRQDPARRALLVEAFAAVLGA